MIHLDDLKGLSLVKETRKSHRDKGLANKVDERAELFFHFPEVLGKSTLMSRCVAMAGISKLVSFFIECI